MENYKSNSHRSREREERLPKREHIKPVAKGSVKKKSESKKVAEMFLSDDAWSLKDHIIFEVLVPAAKKAISDAIISGVEILFYGKATNRISGGSPVSRFSYDKCYASSPNTGYPRAEPRRNMLDYDDIKFDNRGDAEMVLDAMDDILGRFGVVRLSDLYDLAQISTNNYMLEKYGWTDLRSARVVPVYGGYMIKLPRAYALD